MNTFHSPNYFRTRRFSLVFIWPKRAHREPVQGLSATQAFWPLVCFDRARPGSRCFSRLRGSATSPFPTCQDSQHDVDSKIRTHRWQRVPGSFIPRINCTCWQGFDHLTFLFRQNGGKSFSFYSFLGSLVREERFKLGGRFIFELVRFPRRMGSGTLADFLIFTSFAQYSIQWIDTALFKRMEFVYLNDVSPPII